MFVFEIEKKKNPRNRLKNVHQTIAFFFYLGYVY